MSTPQSGFDPTLRFVRRRGRRPNGFVEFEFAIGEPGVFIEMVLEPEAYEDFCTTNRVVFLETERDGAPDSPSSTFDWRPSDAVQRGIGK